MVPQREDPDIDGFVATLRRHMREVSDPIAGEWNRDIVIARTNAGDHIDIQFTRWQRQVNDGRWLVCTKTPGGSVLPSPYTNPSTSGWGKREEAR
jgi:hypothetical protein